MMKTGPTVLPPKKGLGSTGGPNGARSTPTGTDPKPKGLHRAPDSPSCTPQYDQGHLLKRDRLPPAPLPAPK